VERFANCSTVDIRAFRDALGEFATGVVVVTTVAPDQSRIGVTVNSFNSVSLDPPLVLFSVARSAYSLAAFIQARRFAVNVLHAEQSEVSSRFARSLEDKWAGLEWDGGVNGSPVAPDALAVFECEHYAAYDGGDHVIMVGRVTSFAKKGGQDPLLFFRGRYHKIWHSETPPFENGGR
jgi:flavin reductase (DIM6/NTAB) family NADH-FMN oxidoreductase RutF